MATTLDSAMPVASFHAADAGQTVAKPLPTQDSITHAEDKPVDVVAAIDASFPVVPTFTHAEIIARHEARILDIVSDMRDGYLDAGERNLRIGGKVLVDCREMASFVKGKYARQDYEREITRIVLELRLWIPIDPKSVKLSAWVYAAALKESMVQAFGQASADTFTLYELVILKSKDHAFTFDVEKLTGEIKAGWITPLRQFAQSRLDAATARDAAVQAGETPEAIPSAREFTDMVEATVKTLADAATSENPALAKSRADTKQKEKEEKEKVQSRVTVRSSIGDAVAKGHMDLASVLGVVEQAAKDNNLPTPFVGFDPASCTLGDCDVLVATLEKLEKYNEIIRLRDGLIAAANRMGNEIAKRHAEFKAATTPEATKAVRLAKEQARAESKRNRPESPAPVMQEAAA